METSLFWGNVLQGNLLFFLGIPRKHHKYRKNETPRKITSLEKYSETDNKELNVTPIARY